MILNRLGNKRRLASKIITYIPNHTLYIELFFGAGGLFFNKKPIAPHNILNDLDDDVYNLWTVLQANHQELKEAIEQMPLSHSLFNYWVRNKETDPIKKATRFLMLSNFSLYGSSETFRVVAGNTKAILLRNLETLIPSFGDTKFLCDDFRDVLPKITIRDNDVPFIYADPPYLGTSNNGYSAPLFKEQDTIDLFSLLVGSGHKFAISEFSHPQILELATEHGLFVNYISERRTIKSRNTEVLITNYPPPRQTLFCGQ